MKNLLLISAICMVATAGFSATKTPVKTEVPASEYQPYGEFRLSSNFGEFKVGDAIGVKDNGVLGASFAIGTKIDNVFRLELEGYYNDTYKYSLSGAGIGYDDLAADLEAKAKGFFLNAYVDFPLERAPKWKPYIGGGIGYSWLEGSIGGNFDGSSLYGSEKGHDWGWNIGLGVAYELKEGTSLTLGYRHENLGTLKIADLVPVEYKNDKVSLGLRIDF